MTNTEHLIDQAIKYCNFEDGKAYVFMLIPRKKENGENTEKEKLGLLQRRIVVNETEAKEALEFFYAFSQVHPNLRFRFYINVNRRDLAKGLFMMSEQLLRMQKDMFNGNKEVFQRITKAGSIMKSVLCRKACRDEKRFQFDCDQDNKTSQGRRDYLDVLKVITELTTVLYEGKTLNGYVIITDPFNPQDLKNKYNNSLPKDVEIKQDGYLYLGIFN